MQMSAAATWGSEYPSVRVWRRMNGNVLDTIGRDERLGHVGRIPHCGVGVVVGHQLVKVAVSHVVAHFVVAVPHSGEFSREVAVGACARRHEAHIDFVEVDYVEPRHEVGRMRRGQIPESSVESEATEIFGDVLPINCRSSAGHIGVGIVGTDFSGLQFGRTRGKVSGEQRAVDNTGLECIGVGP